MKRTMSPDIDYDARDDHAEKAMVDLVRRLVVAAREGRAHLSHEDGASCLGCKAVRDGLNFVHLMTTEGEDAA